MPCNEEEHQFLNIWGKNIDKTILKQHSESWHSGARGYFGFIPDNAIAMFLGTFPILPKTQCNFFYHSDINQFWSILSIISGCDLSSIDKKLNWLKEKRIGITDILQKARRTNKGCNSSADINLHPEGFNNVLKLLQEQRGIRHVFLTSGGPKSKSLSGKSAGGWLGAHIRKEALPFIPRGHEDGASLEINLPFNGFDPITLHFLLTPAPRSNQLIKYLRETKEAKNALQQIQFLNSIVPIDDIKRYKCLQWAVYLSKIDGAVHPDFLSEIKTNILQGLLMESDKFQSMPL